MKNLKEFTKAKTLSKQEQQIIKGGQIDCRPDYSCPGLMKCINGVCQYSIE